MSARLSLREFARQAGCDEKQVRRAIEKGLLFKGEGGLLSEDDVHGQWRRPNRRGVIRIAADNAEEVRTTSDVRTGADKLRRRPVVRSDETPEQAAERVVAEAGLLSLPDALQLKENYLARHQQLSYDLKAGSVVLIEDVAKTVSGEYAAVRRKLLAIAAERAPALHRLKTVAEVESLLRSVIVEALEGLTFDGQPAS